MKHLLALVLLLLCTVTVVAPVSADDLYVTPDGVGINESAPDSFGYDVDANGSSFSPIPVLDILHDDGPSTPNDGNKEPATIQMISSANTGDHAASAVVGVQSKDLGSGKNRFLSRFFIAPSYRATVTPSSSYSYDGDAFNIVSGDSEAEELEDRRANVGIGTTTPRSKLHVDDELTVSNASSQLDKTATITMYQKNYDTDDNTMGELVMMGYSSGGVNKERGAIRFNSLGGGWGRGSDIDFYTRAYGSGTSSTRNMRLDGNAYLYLNTTRYSSCTTLGTDGSAKVTCAPSSARFKTDVAEYRRGLDVVMGLRPVSFEYVQYYDQELDLWHSPFPDGTQIGFLAEEVEQIEPIVTGVDAEGRVSNVNYQELTVILTNAIQEQQARIEELEAKVQLLAERAGVS